DRERAFILDDLGAALVAEFLPDVLELVGNQLHQFFGIGEDLLEPYDGLLDLLMLLLDLLALESGQAAQRHVEDRRRLGLGELELPQPTRARGPRLPPMADSAGGRGGGCAGEEQSFQHVDARLGLAQLELRAPREHALAMIEELLEHRAQVELARAALV